MLRDAVRTAVTGRYAARSPKFAHQGGLPGTPRDRDIGKIDHPGTDRVVFTVTRLLQAG